MLPPAKLYFFENAMPSRKDTRLTTQNIITVAGITEEGRDVAVGLGSNIKALGPEL